MALKALTSEDRPCVILLGSLSTRPVPRAAQKTGVKRRKAGFPSLSPPTACKGVAAPIDEPYERCTSLHTLLRSPRPASPLKRVLVAWKEKSMSFVLYWTGSVGSCADVLSKVCSSIERWKWSAFRVERGWSKRFSERTKPSKSLALRSRPHTVTVETVTAALEQHYDHRHKPHRTLPLPPFPPSITSRSRLSRCSTPRLVLVSTTPALAS